MVAEVGHEWPIDYQDMLCEYGTAAELEQRVDEWVSAAIAPAADIGVLQRIGPGKGRIDRFVFGEERLELCLD